MRKENTDDSDRTDLNPSERGEGAAGPGGSAKTVAPRRRWKRFLIAFCAAVVLLFGLPRLLDRQPRYQGHTVESWLLQIGDTQNMEQARLVLRGMGREAIPHVVKALGRRNNAFLDRYTALRDRLPSALRNMLPERAHPNHLRWAAGYELRGNDYSLEFLPEIVKLLEDSDPGVRIETSWTLLELMKRVDIKARLDIAAIPTLCRCLRNDDADVRYAATAVILSMGSNAVGAAPNLVRLLNDTNNVASLAAHALVEVHEPDFRTKLPTGIVARIEKLLTDETNRIFSSVTNR